MEESKHHAAWVHDTEALAEAALARAHAQASALQDNARALASARDMLAASHLAAQIDVPEMYVHSL